MFNRVHGQTRPRADVDVFMMEIVSRFVEGFPVRDAVYPVEVEESPKLNAAEEEDKIDGMGSPI